MERELTILRYDKIRLREVLCLITGCPDPQFEWTSKRWMCGCTEGTSGKNHGDHDGWLTIHPQWRERAHASEQKLADARQALREIADTPCLQTEPSAIHMRKLAADAIAASFGKKELVMS